MTDEELNKIRTVLREEVTSSEERLTEDIGKFMEDQLFPMIEEKADKSDIESLGRRFDAFSTKVALLSTRLEKIASTPTVTHELKLKK